MGRDELISHTDVGHYSLIMENYSSLHLQTHIVQIWATPNVAAIHRAWPTEFPTNTHPLLLLDCYSLRNVIRTSTVERSLIPLLWEAP